MTSPLALDEDHHVHSSFSDDAVSTLAENAAAARRRGLRVLVLADHVRQDSDWVPEFLSAVDELPGEVEQIISVGCENDRQRRTARDIAWRKRNVDGVSTAFFCADFKLLVRSGLDRFRLNLECHEIVLFICPTARRTPALTNLDEGANRIPSSPAERD